MSEANKAVIHRWVKAINEGNADINEELFTPETDFHVPRGTAPGREGRPRPQPGPEPRAEEDASIGREAPTDFLEPEGRTAG